MGERNLLLDWPDKVKDDGSSITNAAIIACVVAASGGLMFGYDIGVSGGVSAMESFLKAFFPDIVEKMADPGDDFYCTYNSAALTAFTSSLYIAGFVASLVAGGLSKAIGRQALLLTGGVTFFAGAAVNAAAMNIAMLIIGRLLLGFGVGFTNQAAPLYLAETAPTKWRGAFVTGICFFNGIGVSAANLVNYAASHISTWGWRLSLGLAAVPASIVIVGSFFIPDTPSSLVHRCRLDDARAALLRIRGPAVDVEAELDDTVRSVAELRKREEGAFRRIFLRKNRQHLVMAMTIPLFQQLTGIVVIAFFSPLLFRVVGFGSNSALMGAVILGVVNLGSTLFSTFTVDRYGRKVAFVLGGIQMLVCLVALTWILGAKTTLSDLSEGYKTAVLLLTCVFAAGYGWSWGTLSWVVPSEIFPLDIRSAGQSITVAINLGFTFVQTQTFLSMLCRFRNGTFAYFAVWVVVMTAFVVALLPETKGVALEAMGALWRQHWYWSRFAAEDDDEDEQHIAVTSDRADDQYDRKLLKTRRGSSTTCA